MSKDNQARAARPSSHLGAALLCALVVVAALFAAGAADAAKTKPAKVKLVEVGLENKAAYQRLVDLGLDVGHAESDSVEIMVHTPAEAELLRDTGYTTRVLSENLAQDGASVLAQAATANVLASPLPTGRTSYRTMDEINDELFQLAGRYPDRVKLFELPYPSLLGERIYGVEITHDVKTNRGKPVFLNTGVHHAREWPTAEFVLEFAWELLGKDGVDAEITSLLERGKMIVVPVVNVDGYEMSRSLVNEQKRKNCRILPGVIPTREECASPSNSSQGVDPNRNYGPFWGGFGASTSRTASNYRGEAPFSEPEIQNMRDLAAANQVTVAINNHTPDARLLRAPSSLNEPRPVADETVYQRLAERLGEKLSWPAGPWTDVYYQASGTAEENAYYSAGTMAFTTEATPGHRGLATFHPPYQYVIDQYAGTGFYQGSSIREAFMTAFGMAIDPSLHSVITGTAPAGIELTISKGFELFTSPFSAAPGQPAQAVGFPARLQSTFTVPRSGDFSWHVNPSLRPSQFSGSHIVEPWTITCKLGPNRIARQVSVVVGRGETASVDLSRCPSGPKVPVDERWGSKK